LPRRREAHAQRGDRAHRPAPDHDFLRVKPIGQQAAREERAGGEKGGQAQYGANFLRGCAQLLHVERHDVDEQAFAATPQKEGEGDEFDVT
jgi:hypothetical protein